MTTDAVEILHRRYGNGFFKRLRRRLHAWKFRKELKKEKREYLQAFHDGYVAGKKDNEKYPFLKPHDTCSFTYREQ